MDKTKEKVALLVIDMQEGFLKEFMSKEYAKLTDNISKSITIFKEKLSPIINVTYKDSGKLDQCIHHYDKNVEKDGWDAFYNTNLDNILEREKITRIIPAGVQSYACVKDTVFSAKKYGYEVLMCLPLIGGSDERMHEKYTPIYKKAFKNIELKDLHKIF